MSESPLSIQLVGRHPSYVPMVTNNWILSSAPNFHRRIPRNVWTTYEHALIERYWRDKGMVWVFAANAEDTNFVYGWLCGEHTDMGPILHYVYVRNSMRDTNELRLGVLDTLLAAFCAGLDTPQERISYTRTTPNWERELHDNYDLRKYADEWFYNPYLAYDEFKPKRSA